MLKPIVVITAAMIFAVAAAAVFGSGVVAQRSADLAARSSVIAATAAGSERVVFAAARPLIAGSQLVDAAQVNDLLTVIEDLAALEERYRSVEPDDVLVARVIAGATSTAEALSIGDLSLADDRFSADLLQAHNELTERLEALQTETVGDIEAQAGSSRWAVLFSAWLVALVIPGSIVLVYRAASRRQVRLHEVAAASRLAAEREIVRAKDEFLANVSHELRTPLTAIFGFSSALLEGGLADPSATEELIEIIHEQTAELQRLVEDILSTARSESGTLSFRCVPTNVAEQVSTVLQPYLRSGHRIGQDCASVPATADSERLRQVIRNLVSNGLRHGSEPISVIGRVEGDRYVLVVRDAGPGVDPALENRLFERFVHRGAAPLVEGSVGLGLSVCATLMEGMGGTLSYARVDDATLFFATMELAEQATEDSLSPVVQVSSSSI
jgi:signal transduction histidine kinase